MLQDKNLEIYLALATRTFSKADIVYSAAKDTILVYDEDTVVAEIKNNRNSDGNTELIRGQFWHKEEGEISPLEWVGTSNHKISLSESTDASVQHFKQIEFDSFNWSRTTTWAICFSHSIDPRRLFRKDSLSSKRVVDLMRKRILKKGLQLGDFVTKEEYIDLHSKVRTSSAAKKCYHRKKKSEKKQTVELKSKPVAKPKIEPKF